MAEGPIRRACNRCHTQKLSCKRLGNEPCERCVRLKAECKSSPSLRFRKPSNGSNGGAKSSSLRQSSSSQQDHPSQKRTSPRTARLPVYTMPGMPYPGPYSFDEMAEHLWQGHNVDAGLLIYHSDGNQIYQALAPPQMNFMSEKDGLSQGGLFARSGGAPLGEAHPFSSVPPSTTAMPMLSSLSHQWTTPSIPQSIVGSNSCDWHDGMGVGASTKARFETSLLSANGDLTNSNMLGAPAQIHPSHTAQPAKLNDARGQYGTQSRSPKTVPNTLVSDLCDMSAQLWEMSNSIPAASTAILLSATDGLSAQSSSSSKNDWAFPMDSLFTVSRSFIQTAQRACRGANEDLHNGNSNGNDLGQPGGETAMGHGSFTRTSSSSPDSTMGLCNDKVDAESFVLLADSTYAALMDVYQRIFHLVDTTATNERPPSPPHNGGRLFMAANKDNMKQSLHVVTASSSWKDTAARACLKICRFPDVSVGGFPVASTPALQLGLGLRLADDFLVHFSHAVAELHSCFPSTMHVDGVTASIMGEQQQLPTVTRNDLPHPPLVLSDDFLSGDGLGASMDWDASTATSVTSSGSTALFSLQSGMGGIGLSRASSMDDIVVRELDLRQELAGLRNKLAA